MLPDCPQFNDGLHCHPWKPVTQSLSGWVLPPVHFAYSLSRLTFCPFPFFVMLLYFLLWVGVRNRSRGFTRGGWEKGGLLRLEKRLRGEDGARLFRGAQGWDESQLGHVGTWQLLTQYKEKKFLPRRWSKEVGHREAMRSLNSTGHPALRGSAWEEAAGPETSSWSCLLT